MVAYVFPTTPQIGDTYERWIWDGEKWALCGHIVEFIELFDVAHPDQLFIIPIGAQ